MYPTTKETVTIGRVTNEPQKGAQISQAQLQQILAQNQQMHAQMAAMQEQLQNQQRQPVAKTYSMMQVQILLSCENINNILEEFELSVQKSLRLKMARDYLLSLSDLAEFIKREEPEPEVEPEPGMDQPDVPIEQLYEESQTTAQAQDIAAVVEPYQGTSNKTVAEEIEKINRHMAELKKEEAIAQKPKTGFEKIKAFIGKKNTPSEDTKKSYEQYDIIPEGVG